MVGLHKAVGIARYSARATEATSMSEMVRIPVWVLSYRSAATRLPVRCYSAAGVRLQGIGSPAHARYRAVPTATMPHILIHDSKVIIRGCRGSKWWPKGLEIPILTDRCKWPVRLLTSHGLISISL